jgi:prevent-host-death family protein
MVPVSIREARRRLSELVDAAQRGEAVVITRRGKQVARLSAVREEPRQRLPDLTAFRASVKSKGKPLSQLVSESRRGARY